MLIHLVLATALAARPNLSEPDALARALATHAVNAPELANLNAAITYAVKRGLRDGFRWGGINVNRHGDEVIVYVEDVTGLQQDVCDGKQPEVCAPTKVLSDNCVVIDAHTIVCDLPFVWRLERNAVLLALSSIKNPANGHYYFPRGTLRYQFLAGEPEHPTVKDILSNVSLIEQMLSKPPGDTARETFDRVLRGFADFVFLHETGHVVLGHVTAGALPQCAALPPLDVAQALARLCSAPDQREIDADAYATSIMEKSVTPNEFSPERTAPEFFIEDLWRRQYLAARDIGVNPQTWDAARADKTTVDAYTIAWLRREAGGSHPTDMARYFALMNAWQGRGITLTASHETVKTVTDALTAIHHLCEPNTP